MIKRLKELREKATPGPWEMKVSSCNPEDYEPERCWVMYGEMTIFDTICQYDTTKLIVETINNLDKLLAVCEAVQEIHHYAKNFHGGVVDNPWYRLDKALAALEEE